METKRKIILISRHGVAPQGPLGSLDSLVPETVERLYENSGGALRGYVKEAGLTFGDIFLRYSDKVRTKYTGQAITLGALNLQPVPKSIDDLKNISFSGLDSKEDPGLGYAWIKTNLQAAMKDKLELYLDKWFANPDSNQYEGVEVTPFNETLAQGKERVRDALANLKSKELGVVVSHGGVVEQIVMAAINSAREKPVSSFDEIGGQFAMEDYALLVMDYKRSQGLESGDARILRNGKEYRVNLTNLL